MAFKNRVIVSRVSDLLSPELRVFTQLDFVPHCLGRHAQEVLTHFYGIWNIRTFCERGGTVGFLIIVALGDCS